VTNKKRRTAAEIRAKLEEASALAAEGRTQSEIAQALDISVMTFHRWRKALSQRLPSAARLPTQAPLTASRELTSSEQLERFAQLQLENTRLRKLVTDLLLEKMQLEDETPTISRLGLKRVSG
jgi:transposase-like protein